MKRELHLSIQIPGTSRYRTYFVDDFKSITFTYSEMTNSYLIGFKQYHKQLLISTKHFHLTGQTYVRSFDNSYRSEND